MRAIGFSTGALAKGDFETGVRISRSLQCTALELSALRLEELDPLVKFVTSTDLTDFEYVSIHAPSQLTSALEESVISVLHQMSSQRGWNIVVHPDCISNFAAWNAFGERLNIENMEAKADRQNPRRAGVTVPAPTGSEDVFRYRSRSTGRQHDGGGLQDRSAIRSTYLPDSY